MGTDIDNTGKIGVKCTGFGELIQVYGSGSSPLWVQNMVADPPHVLDAGGFPA